MISPLEMWDEMFEEYFNVNPPWLSDALFAEFDWLVQLDIEQSQT